jgi:hypothetical protein
MPWILFERGSRAIPVDFRRCRSPACGDGSARGLVHRSDADLPVTAFVHVVDYRSGGREQAETTGADCSGARSGNLYIQYWTYYADSATMRALPLIGAAGYHHDDWESVQIRIRSDGRVDERASSHHGYDYSGGAVNWGSDAGIGPLEDLAEAVGARPRGGWGPETHLLFVSGGSHAGQADAFPHVDRLTPGRRVHLVPLEPIAAAGGYSFAISPPWQKRVWGDPEAIGTD